MAASNVSHMLSQRGSGSIDDFSRSGCQSKLLSGQWRTDPDNDSCPQSRPASARREGNMRPLNQDRDDRNVTLRKQHRNPRHEVLQAMVLVRRSSPFVSPDQLGLTEHMRFHRCQKLRLRGASRKRKHLIQGVDPAHIAMRAAAGRRGWTSVTDVVFRP